MVLSVDNEAYIIRMVMSSIIGSYGFLENNSFIECKMSKKQVVMVSGMAQGLILS